MAVIILETAGGKQGARLQSGQSPEERERIEAVARVADHAQLSLLSGLKSLGEVMWSSATHDEEADRDSIASCASLLSELAGLVDGFRLLEQDLNFRLRLAEQAAAPAQRTGRTKGGRREPKT